MSIGDSVYDARSGANLFDTGLVDGAGCIVLMRPTCKVCASSCTPVQSHWGPWEWLYTAQGGIDQDSSDGLVRTSCGHTVMVARRFRDSPPTHAAR